MLTPIRRRTASLLVSNTAAVVATSKRSIASTVARSFTNEEPRFQFEKAHHQVAPLTDPTLYAPQGHFDASASTKATFTHPSTTTANTASVTTDTANANDTNTIFTPSVNAVFDD
ncbi:hypothetical protein BDF20DRAFT_834731 [Mycotypha africana]|uniref:uncharacterized protein n=1 Tax=Mycotypha africana TaxID=64632 RepID=UPI002301A8D5|nr:uncharacterized protein BDF20DRAFT_834731 [Mycotypha africana]KAI8982075.1 hypothetical protein BDF20DRAFT_834731 [Mycotypha africana]